MAIFVDKKTRLVVQGITGRDGSFHAEQMKKYGTTVVRASRPARAERRWRESRYLIALPRPSKKPRPILRSSTFRRHSPSTPSMRRLMPDQNYRMYYGRFTGQ